jgi:hypothetical protein
VLVCSTPARHAGNVALGAKTGLGSSARPLSVVSGANSSRPDERQVAQAFPWSGWKPLPFA